MKKLFTGILLLFCTTLLIGQSNNANVWYFGYYAGIDFNSGTPVALTDGQLYTNEGCASVCDVDGNLLFYSDGSTVWDSIHNIMPNGTGLLGNSSASNSCIIVPTPGSDSLYYIFTVDACENELVYGLNYSIVDMSLNGGYGDVTVRNEFLYSKACEKLQAVTHANGSDIWLITHEWAIDAFYTFLIDADSIHTDPVITNIGTAPDAVTGDYVESIGCMKASVSGGKLAVAHYTHGVLELFDFNTVNGTVSNCQTDPVNRPYIYGVEFSPDESKLYVSEGDIPGLLQYDLTTGSLSDPTSITHSYDVIGSCLQIGPDGKIYCANGMTSYLDVINDPDLPGDACNYEADAVYLESGQCWFGLPCLFYYKGFEFMEDEEITENEITIYPNPVTDVINITGAEIKTVEVYNIKGSLIYKGTDKSININDQPQGVYLVKIITSEGIITREIIKN